MPRPDRGTPGASVEREYWRRRHNREARTRAAHPRIGGLLLTFGGAPRHETAFQTGGSGERALAAHLERKLKGHPAIVLYDRRMPGGRSNIDLLAVAPTGVYVIDVKAARGAVRIARSPLGAERLLVAGHNRPKFVGGLARQLAAVRGALEGVGDVEVEVSAVLCFTRARLPLLGAGKIGGHAVLRPGALTRTLRRAGPLSAEAIERHAQVLAVALPPA